MPGWPKGISLVIPACDEQAAIAGVLEEVHASLARVGVPFEIIVVDDGSTDGTAGQVDTKRFRLIRNPANLGYGASLKAGAREALYDCIMITDADGTYPSEEIGTLYHDLEKADMAVGARTGVDVQIPWVRRPAKWALNRLANYLTGTRIPDLNSGFRAVRRDIWERYEHYFPNGFSLTTTITLASLSDGRRVVFHPINYRARVGSSKIRPIRDTLNFIQLILRTVFYFDPLKVLLPVSLVLMGLGGIVGVGTLVLQNCFGIGKFMDVTTQLLILTGLQILAIGGLADLVSKRLK
jgi:glycosyltransferase involved in cell wall biosynthesis